MRKPTKPTTARPPDGAKAAEDLHNSLATLHALPTDLLIRSLGRLLPSKLAARALGLDWTYFKKLVAGNQFPTLHIGEVGKDHIVRMADIKKFREGRRWTGKSWSRKSRSRR